MCAVLIGGTQNIGQGWDKGVPGLGGIFWYGLKWTNDNKVTGGRRWWYCAHEGGNGKRGFETIYIDSGDKVGKRTGKGVVGEGDKGFRGGVVFLDDAEGWNGGEADVSIIPFVRVLFSSDLEPDQARMRLPEGFRVVENGSVESSGDDDDREDRSSAIDGGGSNGKRARGTVVEKGVERLESVACREEGRVESIGRTAGNEDKGEWMADTVDDVVDSAVARAEDDRRVGVDLRPDVIAARQQGQDGLGKEGRGGSVTTDRVDDHDTGRHVPPPPAIRLFLPFPTRSLCIPPSHSHHSCQTSPPWSLSLPSSCSLSLPPACCSYSSRKEATPCQSTSFPLRPRLFPPNPLSYPQCHQCIHKLSSPPRRCRPRLFSPL